MNGPADEPVRRADELHHLDLTPPREDREPDRVRRSGSSPRRAGSRSRARTATSKMCATRRIRWRSSCRSSTFSTPAGGGSRLLAIAIDVLSVLRLHLERVRERVRGHVRDHVRRLLLHLLERLLLRDVLDVPGADPRIVLELERGPRSSPRTVTSWSQVVAGAEVDVDVELPLRVLGPRAAQVPSPISRPTRNMPISTVSAAASVVERLAVSERQASATTTRSFTRRSLLGARRARGALPRARSRGGASCRPSRGRA